MWKMEKPFFVAMGLEMLNSKFQRVKKQHMKKYIKYIFFIKKIWKHEKIFFCGDGPGESKSEVSGGFKQIKEKIRNNN